MRAPRRVSARCLATLAFLLMPAAASGRQSLSLHDAVRKGLRFHPAVSASRARLQRAEAIEDQQRADRLPTFTGTGALTRFQQPMLVSPLHAFDITQAPTFGATLVQSQWLARYTLFDGGGRAGVIGAADARAAAAGADVDATLQQTIQRIATAYLDVLTATDIDAAEAQQIGALESELDRAEQLFAEGRTARVAVIRVEAALASRRAERVRTSSDLSTATDQLSRLIGLDVAQPLVRPTITGPPLNTRESAVERAKEVHPRLLVAQAGVQAVLATRRTAQAAWRPRLDLAGGVLTFGSTEGDFSAEWQVGLNVSYPIFTGGRRARRVSEANASVAAAEDDRRSLELEIATAIDRAFAAVNQAAAVVDALTTAVEYSAEVARIDQIALREGTGTQTEYLRAEADLFAARAALIKAQHQTVAAHVALAAAVGDLSIEWLTLHVEDTR